MDEGPLSDPRLLKASRAFVCVRLITYQDREESAFIKSLGASSTGGVLNTAFALIAPDGVTVLTETGRAPRQVFRESDDEATLLALLAKMDEVAKQYEPTEAMGTPALPYLANFRVALNVASCDNQPLLVVRAQSEAMRNRAERYLAPLAWDPSFRGRFAFVASNDLESLSVVTGLPEGDAVFVVQPDKFGLKGHVLAHATEFKGEALRAAMAQGLAKYQWLEKGRRLVREAQRLGLTWEEDTTDRVPDPSNSRRARRRNEARDDD